MTARKQNGKAAAIAARAAVMIIAAVMMAGCETTASKWRVCDNPAQHQAALDDIRKWDPDDGACYGYPKLCGFAEDIERELAAQLAQC